MADEAHVRAESAVAELADLVADLRGGGFMERGRILARGARILRGLTPRQRRTLAIEVARGAAPQLVERITAEGGAAGDVDLSPAQVKAVFDMVARLDEDGATSLAATLRDPDWQRDALGLLATDGLDAVAASAGFEEVGELLEPQTLEQYEADEPLDGAGTGDVALPEEFDEPPVEVAPVIAFSELDDVEGTDLDRNAAATHARALQAEAEVAPAFARAPAAYATSMPEFEDYRPTGIDASLLSFGAPATSRAPSATTPSAWDDARVADTRYDVTTPSPPRTSLAERLIALDRPSHRLRLVTACIEDVAAMPTDAQIGVLLALPDGWVRRRALHRLLENAGVSRAGAPRLLQTLGHDIDRAWVAASMVEEGAVLFDDVAGALSDRARVRLAARYADTEG